MQTKQSSGLLKGFEPSRIEVEANEKVTLNITRKTKVTCATEITIPSEKIEKELPLNKTVSVQLTPSKKGEIAFGCAMDQMLGGVIVVN
ncbi:MAG: cupredoxin domain-containing protein [Bdellovibrionales bacterium]